MNEKRFIHVYGEMGAFRMQDTVTGEYISIANDYNDNDITVADKLESLAEENEQLKNKYVDEYSLRETLQQELQRVEAENKQLKVENTLFKKSLIEAIHHERTELGHNVLCNLAANLGIKI